MGHYFARALVSLVASGEALPGFTTGVMGFKDYDPGEAAVKAIKVMHGIPRDL